MTNSFYNPSGNPQTGAAGLSATIRAEFDAIAAGFDLIALPALPLPANKALIVNPSGTDFTTTVGNLSLAGDLVTAGDFKTTGAYDTTLAQVADVTLTLPGINGTLALLAVAADIWVGTNAAKAVTPLAMYQSSAPVTVAYSSTVTLDLTTFLNATITLTGALTLANPTLTNQVGKSGRIRLVQGGSGSYGLTLGNQWFVVGGAPTLSTAVGAVDHLNYWVVSTSRIECSFGKGVS